VGVESGTIEAENPGMNIRIRRPACCGHGLCVEIAPDVFALDRHKSVVLDPEGAAPEVILEAAEACPCEAIEIEDDEGRIVA